MFSVLEDVLSLILRAVAAWCWLKGEHRSSLHCEVLSEWSTLISGAELFILTSVDGTFLKRLLKNWWRWAMNYSQMKQKQREPNTLLYTRIAHTHFIIQQAVPPIIGVFFSPSSFLIFNVLLSKLLKADLLCADWLFSYKGLSSHWGVFLHLASTRPVVCFVEDPVSTLMAVCPEETWGLEGLLEEKHSCC